MVGADDIHKHLASRGRRLTASQVEQVLMVAMTHFPAYVGAQQEQPALVLPEPVLDEPVDTLLEDGAMLTEDEVRDVPTAAELAAPIEDWMTFLHPEQAALVRRTFNGPARIRGAAGTGKTVVGLHRAAYLARAGRGARGAGSARAVCGGAVDGVCQILTRIRPCAMLGAA